MLSHKRKALVCSQCLETGHTKASPKCPRKGIEPTPRPKQESIGVYGLFDSDLCLYIGSTINFRSREKQHRTGSDASGSRNIPKYMQWEMRILEECATEERKYRERYYYDTYNPLYNQRNPHFTHEEEVMAYIINAIVEKEKQEYLDSVNAFLRDMGIDMVLETYLDLTFFGFDVEYKDDHIEESGG